MMRTVAAATVWQIANLAVGLGDRIVLTALLLRYWGVAVFEDWSVLLAAAGMFALLDAGLHMTFSNGITRARQQGDLALYRRTVGIAVFFALAIVTIGTLALVCLAALPDARALVATTRLDPGESRIMLLSLGLATLVQTASFASTAIYRANGFVSRNLAIGAIVGGVRTASIGIVTLCGQGPLLAALVYLVETAIYVLVIIPWDQTRLLRIVRYTVAVPTRTELGGVASQSALFGIQHFCQIALQSAPLLVLSRVSDSVGAVAVFILLRTMLNMVRQIIMALANSITLELARLHAAAGETPQLLAQLMRFTRIITLVNSTSLALMLALGAPFLKVWSGGALRFDMPMALTFVAGLLVSGPFIVANNYLNYVGQAKIGATTRIVNIIVAALVALALVPTFGVSGMVIGLALGDAVGAGVLYLPALARVVHVDPGPLALRLSGYSIVGFAPIVALNALISPMEPGSALATLALRIAILAPVALLVLLLVGMTPEDRVNAWRRTLRAARESVAR